jgi:hypothetical protein
MTMIVTKSSQQHFNTPTLQIERTAPTQIKSAAVRKAASKRVEKTYNHQHQETEQYTSSPTAEEQQREN